MNKRLVATLVAACAVAGCSLPGSDRPSTTDLGSASAKSVTKRPNILLIMADDLGYSDIGAFGGEIDTPNLDRLARQGVRLTNFHASPFCSPTRAMLMSGTDNHVAGFGAMAELMTPEMRERRGYEGHLNRHVVAFPELLHDAGYRTFMAGKWHLGTTEDTSPAARGFDRSYALLNGGASHFDQSGIITMNADKAPVAQYRENGKPVNLPQPFYSSDFFADRIIEYIGDKRGTDKPFFAYLAFTAPHWPLQAPDALIRKYEGRYDVGYDAIRQQRVARMKALGLIPRDSAVYTGNAAWPKWTSLTAEQRAIESKRMAVYAAMVDAMDANIGRVVDHLKRIGEYDNTVIVFLSDNGPDGNSVLDEGATRDWVRRDRDNSLANTGRVRSYVEYGPGWAQVGASPFRMYKSFMYEGGISVPFLAVYPAGRRTAGAGAVGDGFAHVTDIAPTLLELAGVQQPQGRYQGREVAPMTGRSMSGLLAGDAPTASDRDRMVGWELGGRKGLRKGDWKLVWANQPWGSGDWELYDLSKDRTESNDLAATEQSKLREMIEAYQQYVRDNGVYEHKDLADRPGYSNGRHYYEDMLYAGPGPGPGPGPGAGAGASSASPVRRRQ